MGRRVLAIAVLLAGTALLSAQEEKPKLALTVNAQKEVRVRKDGKWVTEYVPAEKITRGDVLLYTLEYSNEGKTPARDATIMDPIPEGTVYVPGSAAGREAEMLFSIDGGKVFQPYPARYMVVKKDGTREEREASPEMYTHIQWLFRKPLAPGQSGTAGFKVKVK